MKKWKEYYVLDNDICVVKSLEVRDRYRLFEFNEEEGILKHWDTKKGLIKSLREIADKLEGWEE